MPNLLTNPTRITAAGNKPKLIDEYVGRVNSSDSRLSIAHMRSPEGWAEPGQRPEFDEFTVVLKGMIRVEHEAEKWTCARDRQSTLRPESGSAIRLPEPGGAEYIAVCLPAFAPGTVHRDQ